MALSKNKIKLIHSLGEKKHRNEHGLFVAEGRKLVTDLLGNCRCQLLAGLPEVLSDISPWSAEEIVIASHEELKKASNLENRTPTDRGLPSAQTGCRRDQARGESSIWSSTQSRTPAIWVPLSGCATGSALSIFSFARQRRRLTETVQATMGAIARVNVHYLP